MAALLPSMRIKFSKEGERGGVSVDAAGAAGLEEAVKDMSVGALAYDTVPLSSASKLDAFSTEFQSLTTDKGAMILHMLRWVLGEDKFNKTMREFAANFAGKSATTDDFRAIAEKYYGDQLTWFFSQWLDSTGSSQFNTNLPSQERSRPDSLGFPPHTKRKRPSQFFQESFGVAACI